MVTIKEEKNIRKEKKKKRRIWLGSHKLIREMGIQSQVAEFMARANFSIHLSRGFCLDLRDGEFLLESSSPVTKHTELEPLIQTMLDSSLVIWNRYMESFQKMLSGEMTPAQAVQNSES